jgi:hypothetical protein
MADDHHFEKSGNEAKALTISMYMNSSRSNDIVPSSNKI